LVGAGKTAAKKKLARLAKLQPRTKLQRQARENTFPF